MAGLPDHLRTEHWFCDVHHSMLIIMFERLIPALETGSERLCGYFVDNLTVYWLQHCIMEEEGFAHAVAAGRLADEAAQQHASAHHALMQAWRENVYEPFKQGADRAALAEAARDYFARVVDHIETADQHTYGVASTYEEADRTAEIAHLSRTRLPLSPYMTGSADFAARVVPDMVDRFASANLGLDARQPMTAPDLLDGGPLQGLRASFRAGDGGAKRRRAA